MIRRSVLSVIVALALPIGIASAQAVDSLPGPAVQLIEGGPRDWFGHTRQAIVAVFGRPDNIGVETVRNQDDSLSIDSILTLHYRAATFVFYAVTALRNDLLAEVTAWDPAYLKRSPLRLGATLSEVRKFFNDASHGSIPHTTYTSSTPLPHTLELWFEHDRLIRLKWEYPID